MIVCLENPLLKSIVLNEGREFCVTYLQAIKNIIGENVHAVEVGRSILAGRQNHAMATQTGITPCANVLDKSWSLEGLHREGELWEDFGVDAHSIWLQNAMFARHVEACVVVRTFDSVMI